MARHVHIVVLLAATAALTHASAQLQAQPQPQPTEWAKMPRMQLERQFAGPLQDTIVQRWRDPADGSVCYMYLPITAPHSPPTPNGYVQYGSNTIGSISCSLAPSPPPARPAPPMPPGSKPQAAPQP
ncbi:hypothetical protein ACQR1I_08960 [Bradyrhizobium sp. HKCCYLS2038]|uniref:hypothetical protein n=1 Tax=unclassified Bradyrhizobium TaxID=2631580 RepID=UPI003EC00413